MYCYIQLSLMEKKLQLNWGKVKIQQTPFHLPLLFGGSKSTVYGYIPDGITHVKVKLTGRTPSGSKMPSFYGELFLGKFKTSAAFDLRRITPGNYIHKLAAKSLIRDLEEGRSYLHDNKKPPQVDIEKQITELSIK